MAMYKNSSCCDNKNNYSPDYLEYELLKTIDDVRRENARKLADDIGSHAAFARKIDRAPTQVSRFLGANYTINIGDTMARHIEEIFGLRHGWLDQDWSAADDTAQERRPAYDANVRAVENMGRCPVISRVQAGAWTEAVDIYEPGYAEEWLLCPVKHGKHTFVLKVEGESMFSPSEPKSFRPGDYIFVDPDRQPENGSLVIAKKDSEAAATFKQLIIDGEKCYLKALNRDWPERIIEIDKDTRICGVVICKLEEY